MNYVALSEGEGVIALVVVKRSLRAGDLMRPGAGMLTPFFEVSWAESLASTENLVLYTDLAKVYGVPEIRVESELLVDITTRGQPLIRELRRNGFNPLPLVVTSGISSVPGEDGVMRCARRELVSALNTLVQSARIEIAKTLPTADMLTGQIAALRRKPPSESIEVPRADETLALSLSMICWRIDSMHELEPVPPLGSRVVRQEKPYDPARYGLE